MIRQLFSTCSVVLIIFSIADLNTSAAAADAEGKWVSLFNGKDLEGWTPKLRSATKVIKHVVNGEEVLSYTQPQLDDRDTNAKKLIENNGTKMLSKGTISLQSESHACDFRKIEIMVLEE